jgi:hypothetical protein
MRIVWRDLPKQLWYRNIEWSIHDNYLDLASSWPPVATGILFLTHGEKWQ